jgi:F-type H+-transporting ATPase subunit epsilon
MAKVFQFTLNTPDATLYEAEVISVTCQTESGEITIMAEHEPLVTLLRPGIMEIRTGKEEMMLAVGEGFIRIGNNTAKAFTQSGEYADSIDEEEAIRAMKHAEQIMAEKVDEVHLADAAASLERSIARIKAVERKKRRGH